MLTSLETHQNQFHRDIILDLTARFVKYAEAGEVPEADREMFDYFKEHYKNSNKGIKGRGKGRLVAPRRGNGVSKTTKTAASRAQSQEILANDSTYSVVNSPISMVGEPSRTQGYAFEHDAGHNGNAAPGMMYGESSNRMY